MPATRSPATAEEVSQKGLAQNGKIRRDLCDSLGPTHDQPASRRGREHPNGRGVGAVGCDHRPAALPNEL